MPFPRWLAKVNKRITNRYMVELADQPPFAALHHRGRTSGKAYRIPLNAFPCDDGFVFALTYGSGSDWVKNVLAAGEAELEYAGERKQFDKPIAGFQLTQKKLVDMMVAVNRGMLVSLHLGRMKDAGTLTPEHISFGKMDNVRTSLDVARTARGILGANGITLEYPVFRHMANLETVYTYEGTNEIHTLILGNSITGLSAFS